MAKKFVNKFIILLNILLTYGTISNGFFIMGNGYVFCNFKYLAKCFSNFQ